MHVWNDPLTIVNKLPRAIPDNVLQLHCTSYGVRSASLATAGFLVYTHDVHERRLHIISTYWQNQRVVLSYSMHQTGKQYVVKPWCHRCGWPIIMSFFYVGGPIAVVQYTAVTFGHGVGYAL